MNNKRLPWPRRIPTAKWPQGSRLVVVVSLSEQSIFTLAYRNR